MGTHGRTGITHLLIGTWLNADPLRPCPVLVVREREAVEGAAYLLLSRVSSSGDPGRFQMEGTLMDESILVRWLRLAGERSCRTLACSLTARGESRGGRCSRDGQADPCRPGSVTRESRRAVPPRSVLHRQLFARWHKRRGPQSARTSLRWTQAFGKSSASAGACRTEG